MGGHIPGRTLLTSLLLVGLAASLSGVAEAYWGGSGSGSGSGSTGTTVPVTLTPGTPDASLYPGGQSDVVSTVSNANASPVHIGSLALDTSQGPAPGGYAVDGPHSGCSAATVSFTTQTNGGAGWTVPAKVDGVDGTLSITLTNALSMGVGAANACQGASWTVYLAAGP
jgi:hypothetical protein